MLTPSTVTAIQDPFGNSYGYSTAIRQRPSNTTKGYNPTFDLWSTQAGTTSASDPRQKSVDQKLVGAVTAGRFCETRILRQRRLPMATLTQTPYNFADG